MDAAGGRNKIGKYRLVAELGRGGMAEVYLAATSGPAGFSKLLVIKMLRSHLTSDGEFLAMFLDEARLAARLNHANVVQTIEVGSEENIYFIAMEFLDGQPLHRVLQRAWERDDFTLAMHLRVVIDTLAGLHHAHELRDFNGALLNVVHRDVTPHNVFVTYDGQIKLVDFGIAKAANSTAETGAGVLKGKIAYISPEQAASNPVDRRADIFSVGILLWEGIARRRMWHGLSDITILHKIIHADLPSIEARTHDVDPELLAILHKALSPTPEGRYATAAEMEDDLERFLATTGQHVSARDVGHYVTTLFADERAALQRVIDEQLRDLETAASGDFLVAPLPVLAHPSERSIAPHDSANDEAAIEPSASIRTGVNLVHSATPHGPRSSRRGLVIALVSFAALLLLVALITKPNTQPAVTSAATPTSNDAAPIAEVTLSIKAIPIEARILLDGQPLPSNPYRGLQPRDPGIHQLTIDAPGYVPRVQDITLDKDVLLELMLQRAELTPVVDPSAKSGASTGAGGRPTNETRPEKKTKKQTLDGTNPYGY